SITVSPEQGFYFETEMNIVSVPYDSDDIIISFTDFNDATDNGCAWLFLRIRSLDDIANTKRIGQEISNSTDADVEVYLYTAENVITGPFADMQFPYHKLVTSNTPTIAPADTAFTPLDYVQGGGHPNKLMPAGEEIVALRFTSVGTRGTVILKIGEAGG
ncbi:MAG: hypothetical protein KAG14_02385, partial [Mycoplasmataceae bacterium]|nr:hypothetical protein [Mycoplasmataceae bacterium]